MIFNNVSYGSEFEYFAHKKFVYRRSVTHDYTEDKMVYDSPTPMFSSKCEQPKVKYVF